MADASDPTGTTWTRSLLVGGGSVAVFACAAASVGDPGPIGGSASVLYLVLTQGALASLYLLGAFGLGLPLTRWLAPGVRSPHALALGLGLAAMLSVTHLLGVFGLLSNRIAALVPIAMGVAFVARSLPWLLAAARSSVRPSLLWLAVVPAVGVLLAAACSPPGWLWSSEFGGYDTLVYHLQLPREWHAMGRVWPVDHNVYSYLPSYVESAFAHLASIAGVPRESFVTADGELLIACKLLHAGITLGAGWSAAAALRSVLGDDADTPAARALAGGLVIATPWAVVTGSMAYNEMAVVLLLFSAVHAAAATEIVPGRRGLLVGLLVGAACGCKPTALLLGAPVVGLVMLAAMPRRSWPLAVGLGSIAGMAMLAPWLVRNTLASGNPVFPMLTGVFGSGHWSAEQFERYASAHRFEGGLLDALRLLVAADPNDPAAAAGRGVHRGLLHPQWAFAFPILLGSAAVAAISPRHRRVTLALIAGSLVQILVWATMTHVQSRFLMPVLLPAALLGGIAASVTLNWLAAKRGPVRGAKLTIAALLLMTTAITAGLFLGERRGNGGPNALIGVGAPYFTNALIWRGAPGGPPPDAFLRAALPEDARLLTVGDSSPLYKPDGTMYATTYDQNPLARALLAHPDDPRAALASLDANYLYVNWLELNRLSRTGWADPVLEPDRLQSLLLSNAILEHVFELGSPAGEQLAAQELYRLPENDR